MEVMDEIEAMEFGPKRGHPLFIVENFFKDFSLLIIAVVIGLIQEDMGVLYENLGVLVVVLLGPIQRIVQYFTTYYTVDSEKLTVKSGLFKKNQLELPLSTITTVDFSQNVIHQVFGVYRLNVDNASNISSTNTKVRMTFAKDDAFAVRNLLISGRKGLDGFNLGEEGADLAREEGKRLKVAAADLMLLDLLKSKGLFFLQLFTIVTSALALFSVSLNDLLIESAADAIYTMGIGVAAVILLLAVFVISFICGMVGSLIRYYGFEILDNGEAIKIQYGLLTKKKYTIQKNRISGFYYDQSILMRLFGMGSLNLFAIGYGVGDNESSEEPMVFPILKEKQVRQAMAEILPQMAEESPYHRPKKGSLHYFFYGLGFVLALIAAGISVYCTVYVQHCQHVWILGAFIMIYSVAGRLMEYKNAAIYGNDENISLSYGGFRKYTIFVKSSHVESVTAKASRWKAGKGVASVTVSYLAPLAAANKIARNVPLEAFYEVQSKLIY